MRGITLGDGRDAMFRIDDLRYPPLLLEQPNPDFSLVLRKVLHCPEEFGIFLADDPIEHRRLHPSLLQLLEGFAGVYALMLADIADKQHLVLFIDAPEKISQLLRRGQWGLIDHVQMPRM